MDMFERGVTWYIHVPLKPQMVHFPEGYICCFYCHLFDPYHERCRITGESILHFRRTVGRECPAEFELMVEDEHN